ncbi:hypothetical protein MPSEU_000380000 [Mayamaea pseudoterrestris]|nr:hypothetical protein MPSEU_000380000 [Mayamaea pseudoterrestris]
MLHGRFDQRGRSTFVNHVLPRPHHQQALVSILPWWSAIDLDLSARFSGAFHGNVNDSVGRMCGTHRQFFAVKHAFIDSVPPTLAQYATASLSTKCATTNRQATD